MPVKASFYRLRMGIVLVALLWGVSCDGKLLPPVITQWDAWLDSPGGRLDFGLELIPGKDHPLANLINGAERINVPRVEWDGETLLLGIDYYDSSIHASLQGGRLLGEWTRMGPGGVLTRMPFHATRQFNSAPDDSVIRSVDSIDARIEGSYLLNEVDRLPNRWTVKFDSSEDLAVGIFDVLPRGEVQGTFLTTTGDYRFLGGSFRDNTLRLSVFDGAHAFLFIAQQDEHGNLAGDFWSRDSWHETWTAIPDPDATLPDAFTLTSWVGDTPLSEIRYPDLDGQLHALSDSTLGGVRLIEIFGSWCPNCNDATRYLMELDERYGDAGLTIVGLAFEMTGDVERDRRQLHVYAEHHGIGYLLLLAGTSDKDDASAQFPHIDRVRSFPTFLFVDEKDRVRAVYTGFSGPATGEAYETLRRQFSGWIETLLEETA